jgi:hypothetical protein
MAGKVLSEQQARAAATDPFGSRMESEVDQEEEGAV